MIEQYTNVLNEESLQFVEMMRNVSKKSPLINVITNFITVNDCANILLAAGASPCMAYDIREVEKIVSISQGLVINLGSIEDDRAMLLATKKANEMEIPSVFDPVAAGASRLRNDLCSEFLSKVKFSVIRGNISEIKSLAIGTNSTKGVDACETDAVNDDNIHDAIQMARKLSEDTGSVIVISGKTDIVTDPQRTFIIKNGHQMMTKITGSGCMLTALIGAYCAANPDNILKASAAAVCAMGICGEHAYQKAKLTASGTASFRTYLIDFVSCLTDDMMIGEMNVEVR